MNIVSEKSPPVQLNAVNDRQSLEYNPAPDQKVAAILPAYV